MASKRNSIDMRTYFELNFTINMAYKILQDSGTAIVKDIIVAFNSYIRRKDWKTISASILEVRKTIE